MKGKTDYVIVTMPMATPEVRRLPVLVVGECVCLEQVAYAGSLARRGWSPSTIQRTATAIGLFHDFWTFALGGVAYAPEQLPGLLEKFASARHRGTIDSSGSDLTGLRWGGCRLVTASTQLSYVSRFFDYCAVEFGYARANPSVVVPATWAERMSEVARRRESDPLFHLFRTTAAGRGLRVRRTARLKAPSSASLPREPSHPTPRQVERLVCESPSPRDAVLWFLLAYGGIRMSEALNLHVDDVSADEAGSAVVRLKHPAEGVDDRYDRDSGRYVRLDRRAYLRRYGLTPRNELPVNDPLHAGWKGMLWDDVVGRQSVVQWLVPEFGRAFWALHAAYMDSIRARCRDLHPFYFVSADRGNFGRPLKRNAVRSQFRRSCARVGIDEHHGYGHVHSLRHFYAWANTVLGGVAPQHLRRRLHHRSSLVTHRYGTPSLDELNAALADAYEKIARLVRSDGLRAGETQ